MKKIIFLSALFFLFFSSYGQVETYAGYDPVTGMPGYKIYNTAISAPNTTLKYLTGYLTFGNFNDSARAALSATSPIFYSSSTGVISSQAASGSQHGYITSTDWTTFNNKVGTTGAQTISDKRWVARVGSTTSSGTPTINTDNVDIYKLTAQTADITSFTTNLSGTPNDGDILEIQITGTAARAITWGSSFVSSTVTLPSTTVTTATLTVLFQYFTTSSYGNNKWVCAKTF